MWCRLRNARLQITSTLCVHPPRRLTVSTAALVCRCYFILQSKHLPALLILTVTWLSQVPCVATGVLAIVHHDCAHTESLGVLIGLVLTNGVRTPILTCCVAVLALGGLLGAPEPGAVAHLAGCFPSRSHSASGIWDLHISLKYVFPSFLYIDAAVNGTNVFGFKLQSLFSSVQKHNEVCFVVCTQ